MKSSFEPMPMRGRNEFVADIRPGAAPAPAASISGEEEALAEEYARGYATARAELESESQDSVAQAVQAMANGVQELRELHSLERAALGEAVIDLGLIVAERLVGRELENDPETLAPLIAQALDRLGGGESLSIQLADADAERVRTGAAPELERLTSEWRAEIVGDASLARGEARIHNGAASVDLRLRTLLERFRESLIDPTPLPEETA